MDEPESEEEVIFNQHQQLPRTRWSLESEGISPADTQQHGRRRKSKVAANAHSDVAFSSPLVWRPHAHSELVGCVTRDHKDTTLHQTSHWAMTSQLFNLVCAFLGFKIYTFLISKNIYRTFTAYKSAQRKPHSVNLFTQIWLIPESKASWSLSLPQMVKLLGVSDCSALPLCLWQDIWSHWVPFGTDYQCYINCKCVR